MTERHKYIAHTAHEAGRPAPGGATIAMLSD